MQPGDVLINNDQWNALALSQNQRRLEKNVNNVVHVSSCGDEAVIFAGSELQRSIVYVVWLFPHFKAFASPLERCMPFSPQIGYGWLFMYYHVAGAQCAGVWGRNCPPHTFHFSMCQGGWAQSRYLQIIQYVCVSSMELRASAHNSYRFNLLLIHNQKKSDSLLCD